MEKPPIDPLLLRQYEEELSKKSSDAAKRALMKIPKEALMATPDHQLVRNADREAEQNTADALTNHNTQMWLNEGDEIAAKRSVKEEQERRKYAEENGKNPATFVGPMFRGTTENLIGESRNSVFRKFDVQSQELAELEAIKSADESEKEFLEKLPQGTPLPSTEEQKMLRDRPGGLFAKGPFDQEEEQDRVA